MLELGLDTAVMDLLCDGSDAQTRVSLRSEEPLTPAFLEDLIAVGDVERIQELARPILAEYLADPNQYAAVNAHKLAATKAIGRSYFRLQELGVEFSDDDIKAIGDSILARGRLPSEMAEIGPDPITKADLWVRYLPLFEGKERTARAVRVINAFQRNSSERESQKLNLDDTTLLRAVRMAVRATRVDFNKPIHLPVYKGTVQTLASLVEDKSQLQGIIPAFLKKGYDNYDTVIELATVTGQFSELEATFDKKDSGFRQKHFLKLYSASGDERFVPKIVQATFEIIESPSYNSLPYQSSLDEVMKAIDLDKERIERAGDKKTKVILRYYEKSENPTKVAGPMALNVARHLYKSAGLSEGQVKQRVKGLSLEVGTLESARALHYGDNEGLYQVGLRFAEQGNFKSALETFVEADLEEVNTNNRLFYETIARRIIPALMKDGVSPEQVQRAINKKVKRFVVRSIEVNGDNYYIDFGAGEYTLRVKNKEVASRNSIRIYSHGFEENQFSKELDDRAELEVEKFWISKVQDGIPVKRVVGEYGNTLFLETSHGLPFTHLTGKIPAGELQKLSSKAAQIARQLYFHLYGEKCNGNLIEELEARGIDYKLDHAFVESRFKRLYDGLPEDHPLRARIARRQRRIARDVLNHDGRIIHNDYSPRNLMVEDGNIVVIDHENYREGHPISQAISLTTYPQFENRSVMIGEKQYFSVDDPMVQSLTAFWCIRQAGAIAKKPHLKSYFDWFARKLDIKTR